MLKQLRNRRRARQIMRATLFLVVPSFVVFYGWSQLDSSAGARSQAFAMVREPSLIPVWPFAKKQPIGGVEMQMAADSLMMKTSLAYQMAGVPFYPQQDATQLFSPGQILRQAVNLRIMREYAEEMGLSVSDEYLSQFVKDRYPQLAQKEVREAYLQRMRLTEDQFKEALRDDILFNRVLNTFMNKSKASMFELWQEYTLQKERLELDYVEISAEDFKAAVAIDEEALQGFFEENIGDYRIPDQRVYEYVAVSRASLDPQIRVTDEEVREFYNDNPALFMGSPRVQVRQIKIPYPNADDPRLTLDMYNKMSDLLEQLQEPGADFQAVGNAAAMETLIVDGGTTDTLDVEAGELGWISREDQSLYGNEMVDEVLALEAPGDMTGIVNSTEGLHILQAMAIEEPQLRPFEGDVVEIARTQARSRKLSETLEEQIAQLKAAAEQAETLSELAAAAGLEIQTTDLVDATDSVIDEGVGPVRDRDYLMTLERGDQLAVLTTSQGAIAPQVAREVPAHDPELAEVRDAVEDDYRTQEALERAQALAEEALEDATTLAQLEDWAEAQGLRVQRTQPFERVGSPVEIMGEIEDLPNITYKSPVGSMRQARMLQAGEPTGYIVFRIHQLYAPTREEFLEDYHDFQRQLVFLKQWTMMEEWLAESRKKWEIDRLDVEREA